MLIQLTTRILSISLLAFSACAWDVTELTDDSSPSSEQDRAAEETDTVEEATIGARGGTLETASGVRVEVPAGALDHDVQLSVGVTADFNCGGVRSQRYELAPSGESFAVPVTVALPVPIGMADPCVVAESELGLPGEELVFDREGEFLILHLSRFDERAMLVMPRPRQAKF